MSESVRHLSDAQVARLLADLSQPSGSLKAEDVRCLEDLVNRVGGLEAAQALFEALGELDLDGAALEEMEAEEIEFDDDDAEDDDLDRVAA